MLFLEEKTNQKSQTNMDYDDDDRFLLFCFFRENGILKLQPEKIQIQFHRFMMISLKSMFGNIFIGSISCPKIHKSNDDGKQMKMFIMRIDICTFYMQQSSASIDHHHQCKTYMMR